MSNTLSIDLLAPRYEVIADYPGSPNKGTIFSGKNKVLPNLFYDEDEDGDLFERNILDKYPHIFKPLQWWEKRKVEEMPEYVKSSRSPYAIIKPALYRVDMGCFIVEGLDFPESLSLHEPATEQEYTEYLKSKP